MQINLIVIRTRDQKKLADFFTLLGCKFEYHSHNTGPMHYSARIDQTILEIYPLAKGQAEPDRHLRLGFVLDIFDDVIETLRANGIKFLSQPVQTEWAFMAIIEDPDSRKVEIHRRQ